MMPRTNHEDFNVQMQISYNKDLPEILHSDIQNVDTHSFALKPGYEYVVEVTIEGRMSTNAFHDLSLKDRGCKFAHEVHEDSIFKIYSQSNCRYECHVMKAYESCQCLPWDFLMNNVTAPECDTFGRTCFYRTIERIKHDPNTHCPHCIEECDKLIYKTKIIQKDSLQLSSVGLSLYCTKGRYMCTQPSDKR